ncbi:dihydrodipicolinate synthase family protein [Plantactinospora sp. DSM 117369]
MIELRGNIPPVITPLRPDGTVDLPAVARLTEHLVHGGVSGLFVLGSCGEGPTLTTAVRTEVVKAFQAEAAGRVPVLAGVPEAGTRRVIEAAEQAMGAGADAVVVMAPQYFVFDGHEPVAEHLHAVAASTPAPIVLYNLPSATQNPITPEVVDAVAVLPNVVALKDSSADWDAYTQLSDAARQHGLAVFQGAERLIARSLDHGADGAVAGIANIDPDVVTAAIGAAAAGDRAALARAQARIDTLFGLYEAGFWLSALKTAASLRRLCGPELTAPLPRLDPGGVERIRAVLRRAGVPVLDAADE